MTKTPTEDEVLYAYIVTAQILKDQYGLEPIDIALDEATVQQFLEDGQTPDQYLTQYAADYDLTRTISNHWYTKK